LLKNLKNIAVTLEDELKSNHKTTEMKHLFILFIGFASIVSSCRFIEGKRVRGNGELTTDQRSVGSFDAVESFGSFDVEVSTADENIVKVEADENLQPYIETYIDGSTLKIKTKSGYSLRPRVRMKVIVAGPRFNSIVSNGSGNVNGQNRIVSPDELNLEVNGSGNIKMEVEADAVDAHIAGSGNISLAGTAKKGENSIHGSGDIRAGNLQTEESKVEIAGSGNVEVYATSSLDVNIMGSGGVHYKGSAAVNSHIAGSGSVKKID
jgi:hypothetical protein